jgi:hypothetical protein
MDPGGGHRVDACKKRFPRCGGILLWCGHDCHPCPANTSILDIDGTPKPAARAFGERLEELTVLRT